MMNMPCQETQDNLSAYLDGELEPEAARDVERHVEACAVCRDLLDQLRAVAGVLAELPRENAPRGLSDDLQAQLERRMLLAGLTDEAEPAARTDRRLAHSRPPVWPRGAAIAACLFLAIGIVWLWGMPEPATDEPGGPAIADAVGLTELDGGRVAAIDDSDGDPHATVGANFRATGKTGDQSTFANGAGHKRAEGGGAAGFKIQDAREPDSGVRARRAGSLPAGRDELSPRQPDADRLAYRWEGEQDRAKGRTYFTDEASANLLVIEIDGDLARGEVELNKLLVSNGLSLTRHTEVAQDAQAKDQTPKAYADDTLIARKASAHETIVYAGRATPEKVARLTYAVAANSLFEVRADASQGAFATAAQMQELHRVAANKKKLAAKDIDTLPRAGQVPKAARPDQPEDHDAAERLTALLDKPTTPEPLRGTAFADASKMADVPSPVAAPAETELAKTREQGTQPSGRVTAELPAPADRREARLQPATEGVAAANDVILGDQMGLRFAREAKEDISGLHPGESATKPDADRLPEKSVPAMPDTGGPGRVDELTRPAAQVAFAAEAIPDTAAAPEPPAVEAAEGIARPHDATTQRLTKAVRSATVEKSEDARQLAAEEATAPVAAPEIAAPKVAASTHGNRLTMPAAEVRAPVGATDAETQTWGMQSQGGRALDTRHIQAKAEAERADLADGLFIVVRLRARSDANAAIEASARRATLSAEPAAMKKLDGETHYDDVERPETNLKE